MSVALPHLDVYFEHGRSRRHTGTTIIGDPFDDELTISVDSLGELWLPSGEVIVGDPIFLGDEDQLPYAERVPSGRYPVSVSKVTVQDLKYPDTSPYEDGVAAARLLVRDTPTFVWEPALLRGREKFYGYGVDSGRSCFLDAETNRVLAQDDAAREEVEGPATKRDRIPGVITAPSNGHQVAVFPSGAGDGVYPTWLGRDADGQVTCFVTTFRHDLE
ncbi:hypothetical protein VT50_0233195 [Streptomyces antioxidans]|uniref:DUF4241 domain-containing protein n=1 Tax=Streptomyces antioxidans TaxID=1507734 RepID=A0A1V4CW79_9ACTN|nr:DUF4241 domain-containing protein [Streptomyces antioxidans]OPF71577.1 hypothetical protein VT50_0233195 [Streptomyces antioxidans]